VTSTLIPWSPLNASAPYEHPLTTEALAHHEPHASSLLPAFSALLASACVHLLVFVLWAPLFEHVLERQFELVDLVAATSTDRFATVAPLLVLAPEGEQEQEDAEPLVETQRLEVEAAAVEEVEEVGLVSPKQAVPRESAPPQAASNERTPSARARIQPQATLGTDTVGVSEEDRAAVQGLGQTMGQRLGGRLRGAAMAMSWPKRPGKGGDDVERSLEPREEVVVNVDVDTLTERYKREVEPLFEDAKRYPRSARRAGLEGAALVDVHIDADGTIVEVELARSSGFELLDRAALDSARSVGKLPAPPPELRWESRTLRIPYRFSLS